MRTLRLGVLFTRLSGYMSSCLKRLVTDYGVDLQIVSYPRADNAPFDDRVFEGLGRLIDRSKHDASSMLQLFRTFDADAVFMAGWSDKDYLKVARGLRADGVPVVAGCDTQWVGSARQQIGRLISRYYLHSAIDVLWVAGERQRQTAYKLGYTGSRCWSGYYSCDWDRFAPIHHERTFDDGPRRFLYVGRYIPRKGIDTLLSAYEIYATQVSTPWQLKCAGTGDLASRLLGSGIRDVGFVQPDALPELMANASVFILPSREEPWGVVAHEAAASGLPLICSDACGAAVHLLRDGYNGYVFETGNADHLASCMRKLSSESVESIEKMSSGSHSLSKQYTPQLWASTLTEGLQDFLGLKYRLHSSHHASA